MTARRRDEPVWYVTNDAIGVRSGRKGLEVCCSPKPRSSFSIAIEYTTYTGKHSKKGRQLALRLRDLLNEIETHCASTEQP